MCGGPEVRYKRQLVAGMNSTSNIDRNRAFESTDRDAAGHGTARRTRTQECVGGQEPAAAASPTAVEGPVPRASVIVSTYNQPAMLERVLRGYARQTTRDFELIIADDGSGPETRACIEAHQKSYPVPLLHVWQPDDGFHKSRAVNRAVLRARASYLIFSDGDCIPAASFVAEHLAAARAGAYVVGGFIRLSQDATRSLSLQDVETGAFERGIPLKERLSLWLTHIKSLYYIAVRLPRKPTFHGLNFSVDRESFFRVNGFDETYRNSGREDSDLRNRMQMAGLTAVSLWHRAGVFHQFHLPHDKRLDWSAVGRYYNRPDIQIEAPVGLRQLQEQERASTYAL